ncbi:unnamed protein product, partial [Ectocarpus fasciculatus]
GLCSLSLSLLSTSCRAGATQDSRPSTGNEGSPRKTNSICGCSRPNQSHVYLRTGYQKAWSPQNNGHERNVHGEAGRLAKRKYAKREDSSHLTQQQRVTTSSAYLFRT